MTQNEENGREQEIREIAYQLWEQEGRPEGRDIEHYMAAARELEARSATATQDENAGRGGQGQGEDPVDRRAPDVETSSKPRAARAAKSKASTAKKAPATRTKKNGG
ncbi:MAG: DUF2934 domain-containing protein [Dehalococcoidia bacterium]